MSTPAGGDHMTFTADDLVPRLVEELDYPPDGARYIAERLEASDPRVRATFWRWWQGGGVDDELRIEGYTAARLVAEKGLNPLAAFVTVDWLCRDPELAAATIEAGYDTIAGPRDAPH
jgi:hypothetical protein